MFRWENLTSHLVLVRMKNSSYYIAPVGDWTHDLPHTVASNMVKVSHALNHSAPAMDWWSGGGGGGGAQSFPSNAMNYYSSLCPISVLISVNLWHLPGTGVLSLNNVETASLTLVLEFGWPSKFHWNSQSFPSNAMNYYSSLCPISVLISVNLWHLPGTGVLSLNNVKTASLTLVLGDLPNSTEIPLSNFEIIHPRTYHQGEGRFEWRNILDSAEQRVRFVAHPYGTNLQFGC